MDFTLSKANVWGVAYALVVIMLSLNYSTDNSLIVNVSSQSSPIVGRFNASAVLPKRLADVHADFASVLEQKEGWVVIRTATHYHDSSVANGKSSEIAIERLNSVSGEWPPYIKATVTLPSSPDKVQKLFNWQSFDMNQKALDPLYEGSSLLFDASSEIKVIEKTTKRPLVFAKRRMTLGLVTGQSKALVSARVTTGKQRGFISKIPKGTLMSSLINCNPTDDLKKLSTVVADRNYISAYQDFVAWFESANESGTETKLTIVTKMDFGSDIPKWAFMMAIGSSILKMMRSVVDHTSSNNL